MSSDAENAPATSQNGHNRFGNLPEWDLSDLYPGMKSEQFAADLGRAKVDAQAFEKDFKGKLEQMAGAGELLKAIKRYEELSDITGRLGSYAFLNYAQNTADPERGKFLGDCQQALTDLSAKLIFFSLELNQIDDEILEKALVAPGDLGRHPVDLQHPVAETIFAQREAVSAEGVCLDDFATDSQERGVNLLDHIRAGDNQVVVAAL